MYLILVHLLSVNNPTYVYNEALVNSTLYLMIIGAVGSFLSILLRRGVKKSKLLIVIWSVALVSLVLLYTGDDLSSLGWALLAYPSVIFGTILIIFYTFQN